jgi:hypothetical protein
MRALPLAAISLWVLVTAPARAAGPLPFLRDDWPAARAEAQAKGLPIFVDAWAPW